MRYICQICSYVYDEAKEKVPFRDLPETWKCPLCGAPKSAFQPEKTDENLKVQETKNEQRTVFASDKTGKDPKETFTGETDFTKFTPGQLAVIFSNLARGAEKQYKTEENVLYKKIADFFTESIPPVKDASLEKLSRELREDIENYTGVRKIADESEDRGAARISVWGEKVTRMLSSLVDQYIEQGEALLKNTNIWVCTVCGFVYIGENAPELCPVCKVPAWKFEKVEGRNAK